MRADRIRIFAAGALLVFSPAASGTSGDGDRILQEESRNLYREVPDVEISLPAGRRARLSELWRDKPLLITLFYNDCTGTCSPFLRALKSAVDSAGGLGGDYRVLSLSFDPADTVEDVDALSTSLGVTDKGNWLFGTASPRDVDSVAESVGFWYKLEQKTGQYDHPTLVAAVRDGRIVRVLLGSAVPRHRFREMLMELKGVFVPFYSRPGEKTLFRCLQVDETTQEVRLDWGLLIILFPGLAALAIAFLLFRARKATQKK